MFDYYTSETIIGFGVMQNFPRAHFQIEEGASYRRMMGGSMSEIAEVVEIGQDRMGIPHVRFNARMMRGSYATPSSEQRTLALDSFCSRYKERIQDENKPVA